MLDSLFCSISHHFSLSVSNNSGHSVDHLEFCHVRKRSQSNRRKVISSTQDFTFLNVFYEDTRSKYQRQKHIHTRICVKKVCCSSNHKLMGIFHMQCYFYPYFSLIIKSKVESKRVLISPLQSDLFQKQGSTYNTKKPKKQRNLCVCPLFKQFKKIFPRSYATFERGATSRKKGRMR